MSVENASQFPKLYYAKHMKPGLAGYENETLFADLDAIQRMSPSGVGKPVYVQHQDVNLDKLHNSDGYITDSFYNGDDGWFWFKFLAVSDKAHQAIKNGWSVSNAYLPTNWEEKGSHINMPYDRKLIDGEFTHLAIVPNPRYEEACIMTPEEFKVYRDEKKSHLAELQNSKPEKYEEKKPMVFKLFRTAREEITNAEDISDDTFVEFEGHKISVSDLRELKNAKKMKMNKMKKNKDEDEDKAKDEEIEDSKKNQDGMYDIDGEEVSMNELEETWRASKKNKMKKNGEDKTTKKVEKEEDDESEKDEDEEDAEDGKGGGKNREEDEEGHDNKKNKKEKKNHFEDIRNARESFSPPKNVIDTQMDKAARGRKLFGLSK